jgi:hypothetical protein
MKSSASAPGASPPSAASAVRDTGFQAARFRPCPAIKDGAVRMALQRRGFRRDPAMSEPVHLPHVDTWVYDLDNTLYPSARRS